MDASMVAVKVSSRGVMWAASSVLIKVARMVASLAATKVDEMALMRADKKAG